MDVSFQEMALSKQQIQFSILFKLQINKDYNKEAFKSTIQQLWRPHGVRIREVGNNLFLAIFIKEENTIEDQDKGPRSFDKRTYFIEKFKWWFQPL